MTQQIAVRESSEALEGIRQLEDRFAIAIRQRELLANYIKERMTPGKHFYRVAAGQKDSLTKEGAELICLPHGYKPAYSWEAGPSQPPEDDMPYQITVKCRLMKGDGFEGEGMGSASSHITKKTGERVVRMRDIGLRHNATLKVAQKSAYIAATLNSTAASEFFTQDMEDSAESDGTPKATPSDNTYLCPTHKTEWFKRGKMKNYAHPIGDTGEWCNMPVAKVQTAATTPVHAEDPQAEPMENTQDGPQENSNAAEAGTEDLAALPKTVQDASPKHRFQTPTEFWEAVDARWPRPQVAKALGGSLGAWLEAKRKETGIFATWDDAWDFLEGTLVETPK